MSEQNTQPAEHSPYVPSSRIYPEVTIKAFVLGALLSVILSAANAYLGLFAGMTVSASIPAAVISMVILKMFKKHNILENNIVQTAASAGESLAAGAIFTFPALILLGYWTKFNYLETFLIALCGGVLGVLFTIPLRSALIVKQKLKFPEGVATAEVLKTGESEAGKGAMKFLVWGAITGASIKFIEGGLKLWSSVAEAGTTIGGKTVAYLGVNLSPALIAVGYIVGLRIATLVFVGGAISWWIAIPIYSAMTGVPDGADAAGLGGSIWNSQIRFLGVGAMVVGGLWALVSMSGAIGSAFTAGIAALKDKRKMSDVERTERDAPMGYVIIAIGAMIVPIFIIYLRSIENVPITALMSVIMLIAGFLFSAVAGYMAGLVGSSNNPISGVTIATILTSSLILLALMGKDSSSGPAAAVMIGAVVCCAAAIAGDNMQDLKAGHILGATPYKQQIMQMVGVVSAALAIPFILNLLHTAYGIGSAELSAPQASLMASVARGVFHNDLPWTMVYIGMAIAVLIILADKYQEKRGSSWRIPVLAVAVGLYLPFQLDSAIMVGGLISYAVTRYQKNNKSRAGENFEKAESSSNKTGLLLASGLITGEALIGIFLAIPIVVFDGKNIFQVLETHGPSIIGLVVVGAVCLGMYKFSTRSYDEEI